uniref:Uncharacterized protein n=1 Tax=Lactuca sativa TaxID=4236 RepID=A0A9R1X3B7_LACSA|nr:hypothetical protein LSAT_V11C600321270 [Lactuca sativa]
MIMHDSGILIANNYGVIVHFLRKLKSSMSFPLWSGPQDFTNHPIINIALLNDFHYVKVDLQKGHRKANISWIWNMHKSTCSTGWHTLMLTFHHIDHAIIIVLKELMYQIISKM